MSPETPPAITFTAFVLSLARTAAVHFGDVEHPASGTRPEPNLAAAQKIIDILALLELKTRGNLTVEERRLLDELILELRARLAAASGSAAGPPSPSAAP